MEELLAFLNPTTTFVAMTAIVGMVEIIKRLFDRDYRAATIILGASVAGLLVSFPLGFDWIYGLILGIAGSGLVTVAQKVNGVTLNRFESASPEQASSSDKQNG